jgi:hypothetical protein
MDLKRFGCAGRETGARHLAKLDADGASPNQASQRARDAEARLRRRLAG